MYLSPMFALWSYTARSVGLIAVRTADDIAEPFAKPGRLRSKSLAFEAAEIKLLPLAATTAWRVTSRTADSGKLRKSSAQDSTRIRFQKASVATSPLPTLPVALM